MLASAGSNIGPASRDFRVPDGSFFDGRPSGLYVTNAVLVIEVLSPDDETWEKFAFYAANGVQEILVAHPQERWRLT